MICSMFHDSEGGGQQGTVGASQEDKYHTGMILFPGSGGGGQQGTAGASQEDTYPKGTV